MDYEALSESNADGNGHHIIESCLGPQLRESVVMNDNAAEEGQDFVSRCRKSWKIHQGQFEPIHILFSCFTLLI